MAAAPPLVHLQLVCGHLPPCPPPPVAVIRYLPDFRIVTVCIPCFETPLKKSAAPYSVLIQFAPQLHDKAEIEYSLALCISWTSLSNFSTACHRERATK